jgi:hypothetical protein
VSDDSNTAWVEYRNFNHKAIRPRSHDRRRLENQWLSNKIIDEIGVLVSKVQKLGCNGNYPDQQARKGAG